MLLNFFLTCSYLLISILWSQDVNLNYQKEIEEPRISEKYYAGAFLIYDCDDRHFACVNQESFEKCQKWRELSYQRRKATLYCAPLKSFSSVKECHEELYKNMHGLADKRICRNKKSYTINDVK